MSLSFSKGTARPGKEIQLTMKAPVGLSAIDRSVQLLGETNDIEENDVRIHFLFVPFIKVRIIIVCHFQYVTSAVFGVILVLFSRIQNRITPNADSFHAMFVSCSHQFY